MRIKTLLLLLLLALAPVLNAQDTLQQGQHSVVTVSLFSPTISFAPRFTIGYIHKLNNRWWAGLDVGYGNHDLTINNADNGDDFMAKDYKLFEVRPEVYYDLRPHKKLKHLLSLELFYINHTDHFTTNQYYDGSSTYRYDTADMKRVKTGLNFNLNTVYYLGKRIVLWQKVGVGIKNRTVSYSNIVNGRTEDSPGDYDEHGYLWDTDTFLERTGSQLGFNFNLDFKLAYIF